MNTNYFDGEISKINYIIHEGKFPEIIIFLHGAHKTLQNINYWSPLIDIMKKYCTPVIIEFPGHGKSIFKEGIKDTFENKVKSIEELIEFITKKFETKIGVVGRSFGGAVAIELSGIGTVSRLGLIAPAGLGRLSEKLNSWKEAISVLWDINDPVINFDSIKLINNDNLSIFTVNKPKIAVNKFVVSSNEGSHTPEIHYPVLFDYFMVNLMENS